MIPHLSGFTAVILGQQLLIVGLLWCISHLVNRSRRERLRHSPAKTTCSSNASSDVPVLAVHLSRTFDRGADPTARPAVLRASQEGAV